MIERGIVDIGVVRTPFNSENLCCLNLRTEPMVVVVNKNGEKFGFEDREKIDLFLEKLAKDRFIRIDDIEIKEKELINNEEKFKLS